jgi:hypothetical protein
MGELEIKHLVNDLKWAISLSGVEGPDVATALARVLHEQPCGAEGEFGSEGDLKRYVCNRLWHNDIRHRYEEIG